MSKHLLLLVYHLSIFVIGYQCFNAQGNYHNKGKKPSVLPPNGKFIMLNSASNFPLSSHHSILKALLNIREGHEMHLSILETVATTSFSETCGLACICGDFVCLVCRIYVVNIKKDVFSIGCH